VPPVIAEWSVRGLRSAPEIRPGILLVESFRYGTRSPIAVRDPRDESGKSVAGFNYEQIGIGLTRFTIKGGEPTVVGTMTTAKPDEILILVLTVSEV
jgi:hypothetical protein